MFRLDNRAETTQHAVGLADFIFNVGYLGQNWADIQVTFFNTGIKLHRSELSHANLGHRKLTGCLVILARSPFLLHHMLSAASGDIHLEFQDDTITPEASFLLRSLATDQADRIVGAHRAAAPVPPFSASGQCDKLPSCVGHRAAIRRYARASRACLPHN